MVSYCDRWMCVVRRQQLLQRTSFSSLRTGWILTKLGRNDPYMALFKKIVQMVPVHCISRSHRLKIDFQDENLKESCLKPLGLEL